MTAPERWIRESEANQTCGCASRTCGAHRCWPSRFGWMVVGGLLLYTVLLHSFQMADRKAMRETFGANLRAEIVAETNALLDAGGHRLSQQMDGQHRQFTQSLQDAERLLQRAQAVNWVLATPDLERDIQLREHVERLTPQP